MRYVWPLAVILFLPGCATKSIPGYATRRFEWPEWDKTPLTLVDSLESYPVVISNARTAKGGELVAFAAPIPAPASPKPETAGPQNNVAIEYAEPGAKLTLAASADGSPPLSFQWRKDGQPVAGAIHALLTFEKVSAADAGVYVCIVTNAGGSQESQPVKLIVRTP